jgi:hypothetical protein
MTFSKSCRLVSLPASTNICSTALAMEAAFHTLAVRSHLNVTSRALTVVDAGYFIRVDNVNLRPVDWDRTCNVLCDPKNFTDGTSNLGFIARMALTSPLNDYSALDMLKISLPVSAAPTG